MKKLPTVKQIYKKLKELGFSKNQVSKVDVKLEKFEGWTKSDIWGIAKYEDYLENPHYYPFIITDIRIDVISDDPKHYGQIIPIF